MKNNYHELHIRIDESELRILKKYKLFFETNSFSKIIRSFIRDGFCIKIDYSADLEVATQIARIGNNINQIAKVANESGTITQEQIKQLNDEMTKVEDFSFSSFSFQAYYTGSTF
jgi:hypothetical protein